MQFRLDRFYRINRKVLIWLALLGLIYLLRDFFALVFLTFLLVSFTLPVINYFNRTTRFPRMVIASALYTGILAALISVSWYAVTSVAEDAQRTYGELPGIQQQLLGLKSKFIDQYPRLRPVDLAVDKAVREKIDEFRGQAAKWLGQQAQIILAGITTILLSWLFAFLIVLDLSRLTEELRRLEKSRLHDFYEETAVPVVRFFAVIAQAFRAQAMIALTNTVLTFFGYWVLGLPKVGLLIMIVFFFSFIPVLGVFISTTPAVLVALGMPNGVNKAIGVVVMVTIIHLIEAYILNPFIYGKHLKLNPVLVLLILFVGHHFFGMWGMLLGVPVTYYFLYYVFGVPHEEAEPKRVRLRQPGEEQLVAESATEATGNSPA